MAQSVKEATLKEAVEEVVKELDNEVSFPSVMIPARSPRPYLAAYTTTAGIASISWP